MNAQIDTSGAVHGLLASDGDLKAVLWSDLDPFTQGAVEAAFAEVLATQAPKLTDDQTQVLRNSAKRRAWVGGWVWNSQSGTEAIFRALTKKGLAQPTGDERLTPCYYRLTLAGVVIANRIARESHDEVKELAFSDLAPEALEWFIKECTRWNDAHHGLMREDGHQWFEDRQAGRLTYFAPLRLYLADDRRVRIADAKLAEARS